MSDAGSAVAGSLKNSQCWKPRCVTIFCTQTRARILLLTDESQKKKKGTKEIASALLYSMPIITNIRKKFVEGGVENALYDKPRPGAIPKITGEIEAKLTM